MLLEKLLIFYFCFSSQMEDQILLKVEWGAEVLQITDSMFCSLWTEIFRLLELLQCLSLLYSKILGLRMEDANLRFLKINLQLLYICSFAYVMFVSTPHATFTVGVNRRKEEQDHEMGRSSEYQTNWILMMKMIQIQSWDSYL